MDQQSDIVTTMKDLTLKIKIAKPAEQVFSFTLDPRNTPKWVDSIVTENTNEWPPKLGTIYQNQDPAGTWREFVLTDYIPAKKFTLSKKDGYNVRYTFMALNANESELEYYEWMDEGDLKDIFTVETLEKLKRIVEQS